MMYKDILSFIKEEFTYTDYLKICIIFYYI